MPRRCAYALENRDDVKCISMLVPDVRDSQLAFTERAENGNVRTYLDLAMAALDSLSNST